MPDAFSVPPFDLRQRVGAVTFPGDPAIEAKVRKAAWWDADPETAWRNQGARLADLLEDRSPIPFAGSRVLDFGCGAGRVLRHLVGRAAELHGVDLDPPSIAWLRTHAASHVRAALTTDAPGLPYPDDHFDIVYAYSVFTHLAEHWAGWLVELHRVLRPGGVLLATVIGAETAGELGLRPPDGPGGGMLVHAIGNDWDTGGPVVVHEPDWVGRRWGRAFDVVSHAARVTDPPWPHDLVVVRARDTAPTVEDLLRADAPPEEGRLQRTQHQLLVRDAAERRRGDDNAGTEVARRARTRRAQLAAATAARLDAIEAQGGELRDRRAAMLASRSLQVTRPLRAFSDRRW